ncbi:hypothetical protein CR513_33770, partial [Mucuna pruriens]
MKHLIILSHQELTFHLKSDIGQEDDPQNRTTKKVKRKVPKKEAESVLQGVEVGEGLKEKSYKDSLMIFEFFNPVLQDFAYNEEEEEMPEDRWYKGDSGNKEFSFCSIVPILDKDFEVWCTPWMGSLVVYVLGKRFTLVDDYKHALFEGPWMIAYHYLMVQRWIPAFIESAKKIKKITIKVCFPCLPIELYHETFLRSAKSLLGTILKIDKLTSIHTRGKFKDLC